MKKKIIACIIIALYIALSVNTVSAGLTLSKHDSLTTDEQDVVKNIALKISNILVFEKHCNEKIRQSVLNKIKNKKESYENINGVSNYKRFLIYSILEREVLTNLLECEVENIIDDSFVNFIIPLETPQAYSSKKGTFYYTLGADIEVRTSTSYIYFYHNDKLINTVNKKFKNDTVIVHNLLGKKVEDHDDILDDAETNGKISLYSAKDLDIFNKNGNYIHFSKEDDDGTRSFIYCVEDDKWYDFGYADITHFVYLDSNRYYALVVDSYKNVEIMDTTKVYLVDSNQKTQLYLGSIYAKGELRSSVFINGDHLNVTISDYNGNTYGNYFNIPKY